MNNIQYPKLPGIYMLINKINNKFYIGKSMNLFHRINHQHKNTETGKIINNHPIAFAIKKYGWKNFEVKILEQFQEINNKQLLEKESDWIKKLDATNSNIGYNINKFSLDSFGKIRGEETIRKMKEAWITRKKNGYQSYWKGKNLPKEMIEKIRKSNIGKKRSIESRERIRVGNCKKNQKAIKQINKDTFKIIRIWASIREASEHFSKSKKATGAISDVCYKKRNQRGYLKKTAYGFIWEFV